MPVVLKGGDVTRPPKQYHLQVELEAMTQVIAVRLDIAHIPSIDWTNHETVRHLQFSDER